MNWSATLQQISVISVIIGVWVTIYGIDSWRREHTGKRKIELAEDSLALFYEAADAIRHIRFPISYDSETKDITQMEQESKDAYRARKNASVVLVRYSQHQELFNKLFAMRYRFMSQIGKEGAKPFEELREINDEIMMAARRLSRLWANDHFPTEQQRTQAYEDIEKNEAVFWDNLSDDDPINPKIDKVIAEMETTCQRVIEAKNSLYGILNIPLRIKLRAKSWQCIAKSGV